MLLFFLILIGVIFSIVIQNSKLSNVKSEIANKITEQDVLSLMNDCEAISSRAENCDSLCSSFNKKCVLGFSTYGDPTNIGTGEFLDYSTFAIACNQNPKLMNVDGTLYDITKQGDNLVEDKDISIGCICC